MVVLDEPKVMGILNLTPDSFYDGGKHQPSTFLQQVEKMINEGADIIDVGGMSSRPGAEIVSIDQELNRVIEPIQAIRKAFPDVFISIDTVHSKVAKLAVKNGADIVNDISAGNIDAKMISTVGKLNVPYILMHMQGQPSNMQQQPQYKNVTLDVLDFLLDKVKSCRTAGIKDIIIDPGFGFGKTVEHNYTLLQHLRDLDMIELPVLVGLSRKSMISKLLDIKVEDTLNATSALHIIALQNGANILRVHDVKEANQCIKLWQTLKQS